MSTCTTAMHCLSKYVWKRHNDSTSGPGDLATLGHASLAVVHAAMLWRQECSSGGCLKQRGLRLQSGSADTDTKAADSSQAVRRLPVMKGLRLQSGSANEKAARVTGWPGS